MDLMHIQFSFCNELPVMCDANEISSLNESERILCVLQVAWSSEFLFENLFSMKMGRGRWIMVRNLKGVLPTTWKFHVAECNTQPLTVALDLLYH